MAATRTIWSVLLLINAVCASFNFIAIGDWGADPFGTADDDDDDDVTSGVIKSAYGTDDQRRVSNRMDQWCGENSCDIIVSTADNFYPDGLETMDDPRFEVSWRDMYNGTNLRDLHWYVSLGNHDHFIGNEYHQINWTNYEPRWHLPHFWFDTYFTKDDFTIHLVTLDTELITFNKWNDTEDLNREVQLNWLNETLTNAQPSDWTIVYGHHPLRSCGRYAPGSPVLENHIYQYLLDHNVDLYIDGHDHNLQHIYQNASIGPEYIVTGGGGKGRYEIFPYRCNGLHERGFTLEYFAERYGFAALKVTKTQIDASFYGDNLIQGELELLHSFTIFPKAAAAQ